MIQMEIDMQRGQVIVYADAEGLDELAGAINDAKAGGKVFLGEPGSMLIIRPEGWGQDAPSA